MDFKVITPVTVTQLGAFDDLQNGFANPVDVGIFNLSGALVGTSATLSIGNPGTSDGNGSRLVSVVPFLLLPGTYSIVASGFTNGQTFSGNTGLGGVTSFNSAGGALSLVSKGGRWDSGNGFYLPTANTGIFPGYGQPDPVFQAGTFAVASIPDAGLTSMMLGLGMLTMGWIRRRIKP